MKHKITSSWTGDMAFETEMSGHKITLDASPEAGGQNKGPRPKELMLLALAGCTGMDVISILKKMRVEIDAFDVAVDAEVTEEHPKHYTHMHITYAFKGKNLEMEKLEKAVELSQEKYCGVSHVYRKAMKISHKITINQ